jgi:hypothetical protein
MSTQSFREIIQWFPTTRELAKELGTSDAVVRQWKLKDGIPARYWPSLLETKIARRRGLTAAKLVRLVAESNSK